MSDIISLMAEYHAMADEEEAIPLVADVRAAVCEYYRVSMVDLLSERRSASIAWPRQVGMYLSRKLTPRSLPQIGNFFGNRDHTTVLHAIKRVEARIASDEDTSRTINRLCGVVAQIADDRRRAA